MSRTSADPAPAGQTPSGRDHAAIFAALGDPTRLALVDRLRGGAPHSIVQLTQGLDLTRQAVSKHLRVLEAAGLVGHERTGRESRFALRPEALTEARTYLERVSAEWDAALGRLRDFVEA